MLTNITSLTGHGLRDWLIQRVTSIVLLAFTLFVVGFLLSHQPLQFSQWYGLFQHTGMRVFTLLALLSLLCHAWVGLWTVTTDYLPKLGIRLVVQVIIFLTLLWLFLWGILIVWGNVS